jgi:hypothetical protein
MVDVLMILEADLGAGFDDLVAEERLVGRARGQQRAILAVKFVFTTLPALGLLEVRQHAIPIPTAIAELSPMVEILGLTADIDHPVDRRRPAEHLAARIKDRTTVYPLVGLGVIAPGPFLVVQELDVAGWDVNERAGVASPCLDQQHLDRGVGGKAIGEDAPRRSGADDHVVRLHLILPV